jgi:hypothetical protein
MYCLFTNLKRKVLLFSMQTLFIQVFAQRGNYTVSSAKNALHEFLNESDIESILRVPVNKRTGHDIR